MSRNDLDKRLIRASAQNDLKQIRNLLEQKADINYIIDENEVHKEPHVSALMAASSNGHLHVVQELLDKKAAVDLHNNLSGTALIGAAYKGHTAVISILLYAGANINMKTKFDGFTPLMRAACSEHPEAVQILLSQRADVNQVNNCGLTALKQATLWGKYRNKQSIKLLQEFISIKAKENFCFGLFDKKPKMNEAKPESPLQTFSKNEIFDLNICKEIFKYL